MVSECDITPEGRVEPEDMIGVDVGIRRLATTSTGVSYTGDDIEKEKSVVSEKKERTSAGRDEVSQKETPEIIRRRKEIS